MIINVMVRQVQMPASYTCSSVEHLTRNSGWLGFNTGLIRNNFSHLVTIEIILIKTHQRIKRL